MLLLSESGLGEKALELPLAGNRSAIHSVIIQSFPQLPRNGYDFCRRVGGGKKTLQILGKASSIGQAKCYLRPIAHDLDLQPQNVNEDGEKIMFCSNFVYYC